MQRIPLRAVPNQSLEIVLGGQNCTIRLYTRTVDGSEHLFCDLTVDKELVAGGVICQDMTPVKLYDYQPFDGQLLFVDMQGDEPPHWRGLDDRWRLVWLAEGETADDATAAAEGAA